MVLWRRVLSKAREGISVECLSASQSLSREGAWPAVDFFDFVCFYVAVTDLAEGRGALYPDQLGPADSVDENRLRLAQRKEELFPPYQTHAVMSVGYTR